MASSTVLAIVSVLAMAVFLAGALESENYHITDGVSKSCAMDFSKVNYNEVTSVCKGPHYDQASCCESFKKMACKFSPQVNDFSTTCPIEFMAYLNYAGNYPNGVFVGRCNSGSNLCN